MKPMLLLPIRKTYVKWQKTALTPYSKQLIGVYVVVTSFRPLEFGYIEVFSLPLLMKEIFVLFQSVIAPTL
jgi:hypothetical protein